MKLPARAGNAAHEYAVPLAIFVLLAGAITYYANLPQAITRHFGLPPDSRPLKERISVEMKSSLEVDDPDPLDDVPGIPRVVRHPLGSVRLLLNNGDTVTLDNYPLNVPELAAQEGVAGVTRRYANALDRLILKLEETGELQEPEIKLLRAITDQSRAIAQMEAEVEAWIRQEKPVLPSGVGELGFSEKADSGSAAAMEKLSPNRQSEILLNLLKTAREEKALRDRAAERFVTEVVTRILFTSDALENTATSSPPKDRSLKDALIRELQRLSHCEQRLEEEERLFCPKA